MNDDNLNAILEVDPAGVRTEVVEAEVVETPAPVVPTAKDLQEDELNQDMKFARDQLKQLVSDGQSAISGIMELAAAGDEARPYEIVAELITSVVNANKELINIHKVRKDALKADKETRQIESAPSGGGVKIDKAVFIGTASDLLRELNRAKNQTKEILADSTPA